MTDAPGALSPLDEDGINAAVEEALAAFAAAGTLAELKEARLAHTGDASPLTLANRLIGTLDKADKPTAGKLLGGARGRIAKALTARQETLEAAAEEEMLRTEAVDVTIPTSRTQAGARHPLDVLIDEVCDFFTSMGWSIAEGPEVEHEWFDFDALNFDADHPARQMQDTFYIDGASVGAAEGQPANLVLRTHTSPIQIRYMLDKKNPPIRIIAPGRVYRVDSDATHSPMFHQCEGLWVEEGVSFADLKAVFTDFIRRFFERDDLQVRFRPSFFPFTEPSAEIDIMGDNGKWLEVGGCGMVHPNVLRNVNIDPEQYTGFAFGIGLDRFAMLRYGVNDLRLFFDNDLSFLKQFAQ